MLGFGRFFIERKRTVFVLLSSKWIDNLLPINHSQKDENSSFNTFLFFSTHPYLDKRYEYRQHRGVTQFRLMSMVNPLYILRRGVALA